MKKDNMNADTFERDRLIENSISLTFKWNKHIARKDVKEFTECQCLPLIPVLTLV